VAPHVIYGKLDSPDIPDSQSATRLFQAERSKVDRAEEFYRTYSGIRMASAIQDTALCCSLL